ncbi:hypothetical protein JCM11251_001745 [Rhodosporidiobolus azoricus]
MSVASSLTLGSPSGSRADLLTSAVSFLRDPSTASSPLAQRIAFLESKGLNQAEIQSALAQAQGPVAPYGVSRGGPPGYGPYAGGGGYGTGPREFERDWRDWFVMGVVGGGVGWLAVKLAQKFLLPSLQPPSETDLESAQHALEAKYDEAALVLKTLQENTDAIAASLDEQKEQVEKELEEVKKAVEEVREGERKRDEWARKVESQVDEMAKSLPNLLDKHTSSQTQSLADLQAELKSLKSLLIARRPVASSPSGTLASTPGAGGAAGSTSHLPFGIKPPGLPSWQLKGSSATPAASSSSSGSAGGYTVPNAATTSPTPTVADDKKLEDTSASGVLVEKPEAEGKEGQEKKDVAAVEAAGDEK